MTPLRQRMLEDMQLRGLAARTQESYLAAVQQLAIHYDKSPDLITEDQLRQYFLFIRNCPRRQVREATRALSLAQRSGYSPASALVGPGV